MKAESVHPSHHPKAIAMLFDERNIMYMGIPLVGFVFSFLYLPAGYSYNLQHLLVSIFMTSVFWVGGVFILKLYRKRYPAIDQTCRRLLITFGTVLLYNIIMEVSLCLLIHKLLYVEAPPPPLLRNVAFSLLGTFFIGTLYETYYFFSRWKIQALETEQLRSQQLRSQLNVLKNQISPHFLFNSLNTLITLIDEDQRNAIHFTERLSYVYRYILQNKDKELVDLATELEFTKSYLYLLKTRFSSSLELSIDVQEHHLQNLVAPLTLQMLIENAVKHNIVSANKPLKIDVYVADGDTIVVKNNLQMKSTTEPSTQTGLDNIIKRYAYLSNKQVQIVNRGGHFCVSLPLINLEPTVKAA